MIRYRVEPADLHGHHFLVTLTVPQPAQLQMLSLPVWINGSYMVREFGRHLSGLQARQGRRSVALRQLDKTTWEAACSGRGALVLTYRVYAFDTSVRAAFLDSRRGFFNNTSLCLRVHGREAGVHRLELARLPRGWQVATAMPAAADGTPLAFEAGGYDELVDHPFELGAFWRGSFEAGGVPHEFIVAGALPGFDGERLLADARRICDAQIRFWHGEEGSRAPFDRYVFLLNTVEDGYGGLEHRASTALIAGRRDLPRAGMDGSKGSISDGYLTLLGLISHEYFHTWNVKRLKPAELASVDWQRENHTELLWFFEGFTSYYDELFLQRSGLIDAPRYLKLLAKTVNTVAATPGRTVQSVAAASFDAWVKYYRSDENTPNSTVSYYLKGALVALCLDLTLRQRGRSLDALMRSLWQRSGGGPVTEGDIADALAALVPGEAGRRLVADLHGWVHGTGELPVTTLLDAAGVAARPERAGFAAALGLRLSEGPVSGVQVKSVLAGSPAQAAGVSAGDELLAVDGWRIRRLDDALAWLRPGAPFDLLLVRDQRVLTLTVQPEPDGPLAGTLALQLQDSPLKAAAARRRDWLGV